MKPYSGIWPVAPTAFHDDGTLDIEGSARVLDCMIDQGSDGVCILANYSEQFLLSDQERHDLTRMSLDHVAGRVPVIVTISHFATEIVVGGGGPARAGGDTHRARAAHRWGVVWVGGGGIIK
ncbi:MAG: dihydrodipicolinate synthase family protein, partial [Boseongicola sp. SB0664_bin_43]|nr:dihydrodipicolinate synthase family protein [Boseongicola sp. SB0664_bin_43]